MFLITSQLKVNPLIKLSNLNSLCTYLIRLFGKEVSSEEKSYIGKLDASILDLLRILPEYLIDRNRF